MVLYDDKMARFEQMIFADIDKQIEQIERRTEKTKSAAFDNAKNDELEYIFGIMQKSIKEIQKDFDRRLTIKKLDSNREILKFRRELEDELFESVRAKLLKFCETDQYSKYLSDSLDTLKNYTQGGLWNGALIYLNARDMKRSNDVKAAFAFDCQMIENTDIRIGGFILEHKQNAVLIDLTLDTKLEEARRNFAERKSEELSINKYFSRSSPLE